MSQSGAPQQPSDDDPSLDELAEDLAGVEQALERLEDGSYSIDPVSGEPRTEDVLTDDPTARRVPPSTDPSP